MPWKRKRRGSAGDWMIRTTPYAKSFERELQVSAHTYTPRSSVSGAVALPFSHVSLSLISTFTFFSLSLSLSVCLSFRRRLRDWNTSESTLDLLEHPWPKGQALLLLTYERATRQIKGDAVKGNSNKRQGQIGPMREQAAHDRLGAGLMYLSFAM